MRNITNTFEENSQLVPKHIGGVHYPILQDECIQLLVDRLHVDPDMTVESIHRQMDEAFPFPCHVSISCVSKPIVVELDLSSS